MQWAGAENSRGAGIKEKTRLSPPSPISGLQLIFYILLDLEPYVY